MKATRLDKKQSEAVAVPEKGIEPSLYTLGPPGSVAVWLCAAYALLFLVRPWEMLFPWMDALAPEKSLALVMLAAVLFGGKSELRLGGPVIAVLAFFVTLCLSAATSQGLGPAWQEGVYKYTTLVIVFLCFVWATRTPRDLWFLVFAIVLAVCLHAMKAEWEYFVHGRYQYTMGVKRLIGINQFFRHPNDLSGLIVLVLPFCWFLWSARDGLVPEEGGRKWRLRFSVVVLGMGGVFVLALALTNSRTGVLALILLIGLKIMGRKGISRKISGVAVATVLLLIAWTAIPPDTKDRIRTVWDPESGPESAQESAEGRVEGMMAGLEMFDRHPLLGVGVKNFKRYRLFYVDGKRAEAHNLLGQILGELGLVGALAFASMILASWFAGTTTRRLASGWGEDPAAMVMGEFGIAVHHALLLMLFLGLGSHNGYKFTWLWIAALAQVALIGAQLIDESRSGGEEPESRRRPQVRKGARLAPRGASAS